MVRCPHSFEAATDVAAPQDDVRAPNHVPRASLLCVVVSLFLLSSCANDPGQQGQQSEHLPPCSSEGSIFATLPYKEWKERYHNDVAAAIDTHLKSINNTGGMPLRCTEESYEALVPPSEELKKIANADVLPAYKEADRQSSLSESDLSSVLLEYLRVYECSLAERASFLTLSVWNENPRFKRGELNEEVAKERNEIEDEQLLAREALNRALTIIGGYDRLRPFALDIECLKRTSLDLRNVLGLTADVASCMPRIWDTKGSLRSLKGD